MKKLNNRQNQVKSLDFSQGFMMGSKSPTFDKPPSSINASKKNAIAIKKGIQKQPVIHYPTKFVQSPFTSHIDSHKHSPNKASQEVSGSKSMGKMATGAKNSSRAQKIKIGLHKKAISLLNGGPIPAMPQMVTGNTNYSQYQGVNDQSVRQQQQSNLVSSQTSFHDYQSFSNREAATIDHSHKEQHKFLDHLNMHNANSRLKAQEPIDHKIGGVKSFDYRPITNASVRASISKVNAPNVMNIVTKHNEKKFMGGRTLQQTQLKSNISGKVSNSSKHQSKKVSTASSGQRPTKTLQAHHQRTFSEQTQSNNVFMGNSTHRNFQEIVMSGTSNEGHAMPPRHHQQVLRSNEENIYNQTTKKTITLGSSRSSLHKDTGHQSSASKFKQSQYNDLKTLYDGIFKDCNQTTKSKMTLKVNQTNDKKNIASNHKKGSLSQSGIKNLPHQTPQVKPSKKSIVSPGRTAKHESQLNSLRQTQQSNSSIMKQMNEESKKLHLRKDSDFSRQKQEIVTGSSGKQVIHSKQGSLASSFNHGGNNISSNSEHYKKANAVHRRSQSDGTTTFQLNQHNRVKSSSFNKPQANNASKKEIVSMNHSKASQQMSEKLIPKPQPQLPSLGNTSSGQQLFSDRIAAGYSAMNSQKTSQLHSYRVSNAGETQTQNFLDINYQQVMPKKENKQQLATQKKNYTHQAMVILDENDTSDFKQKSNAHLKSPGTVKKKAKAPGQVKSPPQTKTPKKASPQAQSPSQLKVVEERIETQESAVSDPNLTPRARKHHKLVKKIKLSFQRTNEPPVTSIEFYKIGKVLGKGAFGKVNLAIHRLADKFVALKSINKSYLNEEASKKKVMQEFNILRRTRQENIVRLFESFETPNHIVFVMEVCGAGDLLTYVRKRRKLKEDSAKFIFKQIICGLKYVHQKGILHRDIKLDNILLTSEGKVKICDFGVSKLVKPGDIMMEQCGTPAYIAPEIFEGQGYQGYVSDIWSAGVVLYAMLYGTVPFKASNMSDLQKQIMKGKTTFKEEISDEALDLLKSILTIDPAKRITANKILAHSWMRDINDSIELFTEQEKAKIAAEFEYCNSLAEGHVNPNDPFEGVLLESNDNPLLRNASTKSVVLAPFNSTRTHISMEQQDRPEVKELMISKRFLVLGGKVKEVDRQYEMNNNAELDNGVYHQNEEEEKKEESPLKPLSGANSENGSDEEDIGKQLDKEQKRKKESEWQKLEKEVIDRQKTEETEEDELSPEGFGQTMTVVIDEKYVNEVEHNGYPRKYIMEQLNMDELTQVTTLYYLISHRHEF